jgi:hypothetical protein
VKSTVGELVGVLVGLQQLDQQLEKAAPEVRLKIAIMINRLRPIGEAFDRTQSGLVREANTEVNGKPVNQSLISSIISEGLADARAVCVENFDIGKLTKEELKLADNPKVNGLTLANILPILDGV